MLSRLFILSAGKWLISWLLFVMYNCVFVTFPCDILGQVWYLILSYDVASGSEITPCNKIDKPLVVYIFTGNVMTSIPTLRT